MPVESKAGLKIGALWGAAVLLGLMSHEVRAQEEYPSKPVQIVVPFAVGGGTDTMARVLAKELSAALKSNFYVDNRTGAGGRIGGDYVVKSQPDGYKLLFAGPTLTVFSPILEPETMPFDARTALVPVAYFYKYDLVLAASAQSGLTSLKQLIDTLQAAEKPMSFGSGGAGTSPHLAGLWLTYLTNTRATAIHYRGSAQAQLDTQANRLTFNFEGVVPTEPHIRSGKLVGLAIASKTRSPALPNVPTMAQAGLPQFTEVDWTQWSALYAPAATPPAVLRKLNDAVRGIMQDPRVISSLKSLNAELMPVMNFEETQAYGVQQYAQWAKALVPLKPMMKQVVGQAPGLSASPGPRAAPPVRERSQSDT